ncbi:MAG: DUF2924 domain-containing protein [Burkholderiales bacterium]|nr:DUF2924 domain-containing protein [Burkholderiales bacterium]
MYPIEVDFEVYKQLTVRRTTEDISYNDVIRELLGLKQPKATGSPPPAPGGQDDWVTKGVRFPVGTEFRATYKGQTHTARVEAGGLALNGSRYDSPSAAAVAITSNAVNGWRFWECRLPGKSTWQSIESLRR